MKLSKKDSIIVNSFGGLYEEMYAKLQEKIYNMSVNDLKDTINAFNETSNTNCSWSAYQLKSVILQEANWALNQMGK